MNLNSIGCVEWHDEFFEAYQVPGDDSVYIWPHDSGEEPTTLEQFAQDGIVMTYSVGRAYTITTDNYMNEIAPEIAALVDDEIICGTQAHDDARDNRDEDQ